MGWSESERGSFGIVERRRPERVLGLVRTGGPSGQPELVERPTKWFSRTTQQWDLFLLRLPERSWVPGPASNGIENPERVETSVETPSGFLAS